MAIDFGSVKSYNSNRGFGFITGRFLNPHRRVFFHIKKIKAKHPEIAEKLDNEENFQGLNLWYEIEQTQKGEQVKECWLHKDEIPENHVSELSDLIGKVENIWKNIDSSKPSWLDIVTIELVGTNRKDELSLQRNNLENQRREAGERKRKDVEVERLRQIELQRERESQEVERQKQIRVDKENEVRKLSAKYSLSIDEAEELYLLLEEMRPKNFTHSKQLSMYIVKQKLGYKYKNISGILTMQDGGNEWDFHGGFPPKIYSNICKELGLDNQHTKARPIDFRSFKDVSPTDKF